jgi:hypothetical protein
MRKTALSKPPLGKSLRMSGAGGEQHVMFSQPIMQNYFNGGESNKDSRPQTRDGLMS